jgi:hypothetical protein
MPEIDHFSGRGAFRSGRGAAEAGVDQAEAGIGGGIAEPPGSGAGRA